MKHPIRSVVQYLLRGILWGCTFFVFFCLAAYFWLGKEFLASIAEAFPAHAAGSMLVGIGYGSTAIIYRWERPSLAVKATIHFCVGTAVFFLTAVCLGWIPFKALRWEHILLEVLVSCITFGIVWFGFYLLGCKEAKEINDRLRDLEKRWTDAKG